MFKVNTILWLQCILDIEYITLENLSIFLSIFRGEPFFLFPFTRPFDAWRCVHRAWFSKKSFFMETGGMAWKDMRYDLFGILLEDIIK